MTAPFVQDGSAQAKLILDCQGLVRNLAWQIHQSVKTRVELDDLIAYGQVGLVEAASRFDPAHGNRFITYAYHRVRGAIFDGLSKMGWFRLPDFYARRYERLAGEVLDSKETDSGAGEPTSLDEDARWLSDTVVRLSLVFVANGLSAGADARVTSLATDGDDSPQADMMLDELRSCVREALDRLPEQGRRLLQLVYYSGLSLTSAGAKMGISKSWASRVHDRMLRRLAVTLQSGSN